MLTGITRSGVIKVWLAVIVYLGAGVAAFGGATTLATAAILLTLSLVPAVILLILWPGVQPATASEIIHGVERR